MIQFGLYLPQLRMDVPTILERVGAAETAGFDSVWFMDHLAAPALPEADTFEAWTLLAAVAARTERVRLGHLVGCDPFRHPSVLAKMVVTVDAISNGRLDLGLGWGSMEDELSAFGFGPAPRRERADRLRETLEVLAALFTGDPVTYDGDHVRLDGAICRPVPVQDPLPIHIGGAGEQLTMPLVRDHAHWWNCPTYAVERIDELLPLAGDVHVSVQRPVGLATHGQDRDEVVATAERRFGSWGGLVAGTADEVVEALTHDVRRGVELIIVQLTDFGRPETIAAFAEQVVPRVREYAAA